MAILFALPARLRFTPDLSVSFAQSFHLGFAINEGWLMPKAENLIGSQTGAAREGQG
jgi:hypothetical protein